MWQSLKGWLKIQSESFEPGAHRSVSTFRTWHRFFLGRWNNCTTTPCQALAVSLEKELKNVLIKVVSSICTCYSYWSADCERKLFWLLKPEALQNWLEAVINFEGLGCFPAFFFFFLLSPFSFFFFFFFFFGLSKIQPTPTGCAQLEFSRVITFLTCLRSTTKPTKINSTVWRILGAFTSIHW